jgi:uroporphyrinogen-III synthase
MRRVLVLRPEPGGSATVRRAAERGLNAVSLPLFEVEPVDWAAPDPSQFDGLLLTSANAVRHGGDGLARLGCLPVYAVGTATADIAREAGFAVAAIGEGDVGDLLGSIDDGLRLLHLAGEHRKTPCDRRHKINAIVVYRSSVRDDIDLSVAEGAIVLIHSPRAGRRFAELAEHSGLDKGSIIVAAISREAAEACGNGWAAIESAEIPSDDAVLALTERLCNNKPAT